MHRNRCSKRKISTSTVKHWPTKLTCSNCKSTTTGPWPCRRSILTRRIWCFTNSSSLRQLPLFLDTRTGPPTLLWLWRGKSPGKRNFLANWRCRCQWEIFWISQIFSHRSLALVTWTRILLLLAVLNSSYKITTRRASLIILIAMPILSIMLRKTESTLKVS